LITNAKKEESGSILPTAMKRGDTGKERKHFKTLKPGVSHDEKGHRGRRPSGTLGGFSEGKYQRD